MYILEKIKNEIAQAINEELGKKVVQASDIVYPPNREMGDLSLPMFALAKEAGKNPAEAARELVSGLGGKLGFVSSINAAGPYLNFKLNKAYLADQVFDEIGKAAEAFGQNQRGKKKKVMVEFTNVNTHKQYHVGHVRNLCFGDSVSKLLAANGYEVFPVSYINDFGIHVAKTLWALAEFHKDSPVPENPGEFLGEVYVQASAQAENNKLAKGMIEGIMKKIEARSGEEYEKWQETRQWTIDQLDGIYRTMKVELRHIFYESEFIDQGREIVKKLLSDGILRVSEGAVIADLEEYKLGVQVVLRSDGTATYIVADLSLAQEKFNKYALDESIYITDNRQALHFQQMFKLLELMGYKQKLVHLTHDFVKLASGMIASRTGNVVTFNELHQALQAQIQAETRKRHEAWSEEKICTVSDEIVRGAIKFEMLKIGSDQVITFDIEKALSFQGYTAAYIQYSYARIQSILRKADYKNLKAAVKPGCLLEDREHELLLLLAKYPEAVARAGEKYDPSEIAKYLFDLAQTYNDYYHQVPILKAEEETKNARLALINNVAQVIKNGLGLLGIGVVREM